MSSSYKKTEQKLLIIRSQDILTDSRVQRYEEWYKRNNIPFRILGWNRQGKQINRNNTDYCDIQAGYNLGVAGVKYRIRWNYYVLKYLIKERDKYDIIHACDFDTVLPSLLMKLVGKRVIFDIFDWFSDEVKTGKKVLDITINILEKLATKLADLTILCEEERIRQINTKPKRYIVIPNIPDIPNIGETDVNSSELNTLTGITIGYVGGLYPDRGLLQLLEIAKHRKDLIIKMAGFGDRQIEQEITKYSSNYANIYFYGQVKYDQAIEIMRSCDTIYAMYYKSNRNNIFAAPNKFYESIFLQKPIITTKSTLVGDKVEKEGIGFVIEEGCEALEELIKQIGKDILKNKVVALQKSKEKYKTRLFTCMMEYDKFIKEER